MDSQPPNWRQELAAAGHLAASAQFDEFLSGCRLLMESNRNDFDALLHIGVTLQAFGYVSVAKTCFLRVLALRPGDARAVSNLANVASDMGHHGQARHLYSKLEDRFPDHPVIRRNVLMSLEYDPGATNSERLERSRNWGAWAISKAGGMRARPSMPPLAGRPLRVGYVSADFCQHTVGLFIKDVLMAHHPDTIAPFAYSNGSVNDWVTQEIKGSCVWRDVSQLDDISLAACIREDQIDVLVDLSGHTAGSRLMTFAHRPAPFQVSWLGYFATTGLQVIDAVLLDDWHAPAAMEAQFAEPIIRLSRGRLCYSPVPFAPTVVEAPPSTSRGFITFGSFNNTAKLNAAVFELWAQVLVSVPDSRLVLKWRTFQDVPMQQSIFDEFAKRGISRGRIEMRGASFHAEMLQQYADIDIGLDPFPFTGGLTSCEALWMGVPVITWPQERVVSRQTFAFLAAVGLEDLAAADSQEYLSKAVALAADAPRLSALRKGLRNKMRASALCDVEGFTRSLEGALQTLVGR